MREQKFYICKKCGNLVGMLHSSGQPLVCCGSPMDELKANTVDAANEKHLPVVEINDGVVHVKVGEVAHPMVEEHYIQWIYLATEQGGQRKVLSPDQAPEAVFHLGEDKAVAAFEYCNLHGLWKTEIKE